MRNVCHPRVGFLSTGTLLLYFEPLPRGCLRGVVAFWASLLVSNIICFMPWASVSSGIRPRRVLRAELSVRALHSLRPAIWSKTVEGGFVRLCVTRRQILAGDVWDVFVLSCMCCASRYLSDIYARLPQSDNMKFACRNMVKRQEFC